VPKPAAATNIQRRSRIVQRFDRLPLRQIKIKDFRCNSVVLGQLLRHCKQAFAPTCNEDKADTALGERCGERPADAV
jgi:hypothetical protein